MSTPGDAVPSVELDMPTWPLDAGPGEQAARRDAPRAVRSMHPLSLVRRSHELAMLVAGVVTALLVLALVLLPSRSTASTEILVTAGEGGQLLGVAAALSPEEQLQTLLVDLESPVAVEAAAARTGTSPRGLTVVATSPREVMVARVAVTAGSDEIALGVAAALPDVVVELRRERLRATTDEVTASLRDQAAAALKNAVAIEKQMRDVEGTSATETRFLMEQQRNALVSQYEQLLGRATEIEVSVASQPAGFEVIAQAHLAPGSFPPPPTEALPLALTAGLVAGVGLVIGRSVVADHLQREHLVDGAEHRYLGVVRSSALGLHPGHLRTAAADLRALPELRAPRAALVSFKSLDTDPGTTWAIAAAVGGAMADSGVDAAVLSFDFEVPRRTLPVTGPRGRDVDLDVTVVTPPWDSPGCDLFRARHAAGSPLAAVYSPRTREVIEKLRDDHDVLLVDPTATTVEWWLETGFRPDLVVLLAEEGRTTVGRYEQARNRLSQAGTPAVTLLVARASVVHRMLVLLDLRRLRQRRWVARVRAAWLRWARTST